MILDRITGVEATNERARLTSRSLTGETTGKCSSSECSSCTHDECNETAHCEYDSKYSYCKGKTLGYFNGRGIAVWAGTTGKCVIKLVIPMAICMITARSGSSNIELTELSVHHCPGVF